MKVYLYTVSLVMYLIGSFGFLLPYLFSSTHTELVLLGIVYVCSSPIILFYGINAICKLADKAELGDKE